MNDQTLQTAEACYDHDSIDDADLREWGIADKTRLAVIQTIPGLTYQLASLISHHRDSGQDRDACEYTHSILTAVVRRLSEKAPHIQADTEQK